MSSTINPPPHPTHPTPTVPAAKLQAFGEVSFLAASPTPGTHLLLTIHSDGTAAVWDMRAQRLVTRVTSTTGARTGTAGGEPLSPRVAGSVRGSGAVKAAAWLGGGGGGGGSGGGSGSGEGDGGSGGSNGKGDFATGHSNGEILIWSLPTSQQQQQQQQAQPAAVPRGKKAAAAAAAAAEASAAAAAAEDKQSAPQPLLVSRLRIVQTHAAAAVRSLDYLVVGGEEHLLVLGALEEDRPEGLTLVPLAQPGEVGWWWWWCWCWCWGLWVRLCSCDR